MVLIWVVQVKPSYFDLVMIFTSSRRLSHLSTCVLGSINNHDHYYEGLVAFEGNLANNQRERSQASLKLASRKGLSLL